MIVLQENNRSKLKWNGSWPLGFQRWQPPQKQHMDYYAQSLVGGLYYFQQEKFLFYEPVYLRDIDEELKRQATVLQPGLIGSSQCAAFVMFSSVQLEWITIPCNVTFTQVMIVCQNDSNATLSTHKHYQKSLDHRYWECEYGWVQIGSDCHKMIDLGQSVLSKCHEALGVCTGSLPCFTNSSMPLGRRLLQYYYYWLDNPYTQNFSVVVFERENSDRLCLTGHLLETVELSVNYAKDSSVSHIIACDKEMQPGSDACLSNQFQCGDGSCVLSHYHCDGVIDCSDGTDEEECSHVCTMSDNMKLLVDHPSMCYYGCFPTTCICHALYYHCEISGKCIPASRLCDGVRGCMAQEDELECGITAKRLTSTPNAGLDMYRCGDGSIIPLHLYNDLVPDCIGDIPDDEKAYYLHLSGTIRNSTVIQTCPPTSTLCVKGFPGPCYPRHKLCIYERDRETQNILYCRNGAHLEDCSRQDCPGYYKCTWSYCIPFHYVCDHVMDCPWGEDEENCSNLKCAGLLKCRLDDVCVHPNMIGDNVTDCVLSGDDEAEGEITCPKSCKCLGNAVACSFVDKDTFSFIPVKVKKNVISNSSLDKKILLHFPFLLILDLSSNNITTESLPLLQSLTQLRWLRLQQNSILTLHKAFVGLKMLRIIEVQLNPVDHIKPHTFDALVNLEVLNLSYMQINFLSQDIFHNLSSLQILDLSHNPLKDFDDACFLPIQDTLLYLHITLQLTPYKLQKVVNMMPVLQEIYIREGVFCKYIKATVKCIPSLLYEGQCCKLIKEKAMEYIFLTIAIMSTTISTFILICLVQISMKGLPKFLTFILIISSLCSVVYPFYLFLVNKYYGHSFALHRAEFVVSLHCKLIGVFVFFFHHMLLFSLIMTAILRLVSITNPFKHLTLSCRPFITSITLAAIALVVTPAYLLFGVSGLAPNILCNIMPLGSEQIKQFTFIFSILLLLEISLHGGVILVHFLSVNTLTNIIKSSIEASAGNHMKKQALRNHCV